MSKPKSPRTITTTHTANEAAELLGIQAQTVRRYAIALGIGQPGKHKRFSLTAAQLSAIQKHGESIKEKLSELARINGAKSLGRPSLGPDGKPVKRASGSRSKAGDGKAKKTMKATRKK